jgi:SPP1 gp7 family putative phage head morphogenesis protein
MATVVKSFDIKNSYVRLIEKALFSYLWEGIYKPMFDLIQTKPKAINSDNTIIEALKNGNIYYFEGGFKAKKKFTNAQSLQLEQWGAKWDKWQKMYRIPFNKLPESVLVALSENKIMTENKINAIQDFLREVQSNMPYIIESMLFNEEIVTILDDAGQEIQKTVKHLNVIEPDLSVQQKQQIAQAYTNNIQQYMIKDFAEDRIPLMRQRIMEATLKGYRLDKVEKILQQEFGFMANKARFLAFNETNIMLAEFKRVQYQKMGFNKFVWQTRADSRVRDLHRHLNGTVWRYDDPPVIDEKTGQKGLPGETFNCRCVALPYSDNSLFDRKFIDEDKKEKKVYSTAQSQKRLAEYLQN